ncbi:MAG: DUF1385 domain-containing protein [Clostridia bacterium]|nr:DUF1385 domain-containing protein [Clostridia bacterium]MBQ4296759.1 DUF1385 domain-containing protein [Clostridia bacterium]
MKEKQKDAFETNPRLGKVGGQAVMEGVMMKAGERTCTAVRQEDGSVTVVTQNFTSVRKKHKWLNIPILRGAVNFVEMMILSYKTLSVSADAFVGETEEESKFEKWIKDKFGAKLLDFFMVIATVLGLALGLAIFIYLPDLLVRGLKALTRAEFKYTSALLAGIFRILIFILYIFLVSRMSYIRRTFEFHGAEHKSIACFEAGEELTPENAKKHTRFHPRCGTSFIFVLMLLSILIFTLVFLIPGTEIWYVRLLLRLLLLPLVVGIGYEYIMYAGKHCNRITRICSAPGLWMQRLTTREPDLEQLNVAIIALKSALPEIFPAEEVEADIAKTRKAPPAENAEETPAPAAETAPEDGTASGAPEA